MPNGSSCGIRVDREASPAAGGRHWSRNAFVHPHGKRASKPTARRITGKVTAVNISQKGHVEGALVTTAEGVVQLNLAKHAEPGGLRLKGRCPHRHAGGAPRGR